jgi:hypothetical protein
MPEKIEVDRLCPKCGNDRCTSESWGGGDQRLCCVVCAHCWLEVCGA